MADSVWQSRAMQALRPQCDTSGAVESGGEFWKLPDWEAYSESGGSDLSRRLDVSSCSSKQSGEDDDDCGDSVSSFGGDNESGNSSEYMYRKRSPVSIGGSGRASTPKRTSALQELHLRYARQRQQLEASRAVDNNEPIRLRDDSNITVRRRRKRGDEEEGDRVSGEYGDSDTRRDPSQEIQRKEKAAMDTKPVDMSQVSMQSSTQAAASASDTQAIVTQQNAINQQLQAFRQQLTEMKQRKTSNAPNNSDEKTTRVSRVQRFDTDMQTDADIHEDAVVQWLNLLTQKVDLVAANYGHEATENFRATAEYLRSMDATTATMATTMSKVDEKETSRTNYRGDKNGCSSSWHVGRSLEIYLPQSMIDQFLALERSIAGFNAAVETSSKRKLKRFEQSIRQMQEYHHEKLQRVVDESLDELKQVRDKYKKTQDQLEEELRAAIRSMDEWKQKSFEIEHKSTLERETIEFKAATFREKFEHLSIRFEEDIQRIKQQLDQSRKEKEEALLSRTESQLQEESLKKEISVLQQTLEILQRTREQESSVFEQEKQKWNDALQQLHHSSDAAVHEIAKENQLLIQTLEQINKEHALEMRALENRFNMATEDKSQHTFTSEMVEKLQRKHEAQMEALRAKYEHEIEEQGQAVAKALEEVRASQKQSRSAETQTEQLNPVADIIGKTPREIAEERIQELSRKCRALEKLLDKKFEQSSQSGSMSPLCMSCNNSELSQSSRSAASSGKNEFLTTHAGTSSARGERLKRYSPKPLSSSQRSFEDALLPDDDFDTTAVNTTMMDLTLRNDTTWTDSSMTSVATMSPYQVLSRPQSANRTGNGNGGSGVTMSGVPSHADVLALVRKLEKAAVVNENKSQSEPESEQSTLYRTPPARSSSARNRKPPPIHHQHPARAARIVHGVIASIVHPKEETHT
ncbi:hypothetical protein FI667_g10456, partial [Globisporangium splendens]